MCFLEPFAPPPPRPSLSTHSGICITSTAQIINNCRPIASAPGRGFSQLNRIPGRWTELWFSMGQAKSFYQNIFPSIILFQNQNLFLPKSNPFYPK